MNQSVDEIRQLLYVAESDGWETALYDFTKAQVARDGTVPEDQRTADWKYLLPLNNDSVALVIGCGWSTVPFALSETCAKVYTIDSIWHKIAFLNIRKRQQGIDNLYPIYVSGSLDFPFPEKRFDFVAVRNFQWGATQSIQLRDVVRSVNGLLREGGVAYFSLGNRWGFQQLLRRNKNTSSPTLPLHTIFGYRHILQVEGFSEIQFYAPLPHYDGVPLFYVPLEDTQAMSFFFRNIFPLFEAVSPEVKRAYAFEYVVAKMGVRLALLFRLTGLAKVFVPGFSIIAKKVCHGAEAGRVA